MGMRSSGFQLRLAQSVVRQALVFVCFSNQTAEKFDNQQQILALFTTYRGLDMDVFISYGTADLELARRSAEALCPLAKAKFWARDKEPGEPDWQTIFKWIDASNVVIVIISDHSLTRSMSIGQEVGYARSKGKTIIPFVSTKVVLADLGCLKDITAIKYDHERPESALAELRDSISNQIKKKESSDQTALLAIGAILLFLLAGGEK